MDANDLFSSCKEKLSRFRLKELKDVLAQLGLSKQGKKQELTDRILASLCEEQEIGIRSNSWSRGGSVASKDNIARIIEETYRQMHPETSDAMTRASSNGGTRAKKEKGESSSLETKVRCLCDSSLFTDSMVKCDDAQCNVWQHIGCVIVPENATEGPAPTAPSSFYCEMCRIMRADPFWVTIRYPLLPVILDPSVPPADGTQTEQCLEKGFQLSTKDGDMLAQPDHHVQVLCILFNDNVPFRMHWPLYSDLHINGLPMRVMSRPNTQPLGNNSRDEGPLISSCCREGFNKITFSRADPRTFCLAIRIARRRTLEEVLSLSL